MNDADKVSKISAGLQKFGITYDLQSFSDFEANNKGALANSIKNTSLQGASEFKLEDKPITPRGEVVGNLVMKNGAVRAGAADATSTNMTRNYSDNLPNESNKLGPVIHVHPGSGYFQWTTRNGMITKYLGATLEGGASEQDKRAHPSNDGGVRSVIVEGSSIILHNKTESLTLPRPERKKKSK